MSEDKITHITSDIAQATMFICLGYELADMKPKDVPKKNVGAPIFEFYFEFDNTDSLSSILNAYTSNGEKSKVPARSFMETLRELKQRTKDYK